jgi:hypothetical protein
LVAQPIVNYITTKQVLTCSNYGKTNHAKETYHNRRREEPIVHVIAIKVVEPVIEIITQCIK